MNLSQILRSKCNKDISTCTNEELYFVLLEIVQELGEQKVKKKQDKKKLYYISAEFLIGKLLSNNLINLGIYDKVKKILAENGKNLSEVEEVEPEPSLGNGGLGRLAACFLDSIATLGLPGDGIGLNYHLGLFKQVFKNNLQTEEINEWINNQSWLNKTDITYDIDFGDFSLKSRLYDIYVIGYNNVTNKLHLFDVETVDEGIVKEGIKFDKENVEKNLTLFLYPDDSDEKGHLLRIYQQYFMVSNGARFILDECISKGCNLHDLHDYAVIQINDTHPTMVIPELIRLLVEKGIEIDEAIEIVSKTCAYTNHTILAEALEKWPIAYLEKAVPQLVPIIKILDEKVREKYDDESFYIIDKNNNVHMAHIDIHYTFSVNGVASLHTDILKNNELHNFYEIYPEKFNNKTNGVTHRRWLAYCNPQLSEVINETIGKGWIKQPAQLENLMSHVNDPILQERFLAVKRERKQILADYIKEHNGIEVDVDSIFDVQVKRLHAYKRQLLNILHVIYLYQEMKSNPDFRIYPHTFIFGAKAASAYYFAKKVIKLINAVGDVVNNDPETNKYLKVVFLENYGVTLAEKIMPAADVSEQISTAGKEASGTGNMKFMMNGAITLGTLDGANVEISELVGLDNCEIFGLKDEEVKNLKANNQYRAWDYYNNDLKIRRAIDSLTNGTFSSNQEEFKIIHDELMNKNDEYFLLADFESYANAQRHVVELYQDRSNWAKICLVNIAKSGFFSSDRTIEQYVEDIWHLEKCKF